MSNTEFYINCSIVRDLMPLYVDDLVSDETKVIIQNHLSECEECTKYINIISKNTSIQVDLESSELDKNGEKIVKEIKKSQDRIKYSFIIFSMFVGVSNTWLSKGFMSTIPLIIIIPFILNLFFKETKVILFTAACANITLAIATNNLDLGLISTPLLIVAVLSGITLGTTIKAIRKDI